MPPQAECIEKQQVTECWPQIHVDVRDGGSEDPRPVWKKRKH